MHVYDNCHWCHSLNYDFHYTREDVKTSCCSVLGFRQDKHKLRRSFTVNYASPSIYAPVLSGVLDVSAHRRVATTVWSPQWTSTTTVWIEYRGHL